MKEIEKILIPFGFSFGVLQDVSTLLRIFEVEKISSRDFDQYIEKIKQDTELAILERKQMIEEDKKKWQEIAPKCPKCKTSLFLTSVNTRANNQTEDESKSLWYCTNCDYENYNIETVEIIYKSLLRK